MRAYFFFKGKPYIVDRWVTKYCSIGLDTRLSVGSVRRFGVENVTLMLNI